MSARRTGRQPGPSTELDDSEQQDASVSQHDVTGSRSTTPDTNHSESVHEMTAYEKHSYIMNVTKAYLDALPGDERWNPISSCEYSIPTDHVMVRDVGALPMEQAFYWLALGHEVWNHQGKSIGVRDLEQRFCPDPSVDPLWARMVLWKQHPAFEDYEPEDLFVLQPGLDPNLLGTFETLAELC